MAAKKRIQGGDKTKKIGEATRAKLIDDQAVRIAEWAAQALIAAEDLGIKQQTVEEVLSQETERAVVVLLPTVPAKLKKMVSKKDAKFTVAEVASLTMSVADAIFDAEPVQQVTLLLVAKSLMDSLTKQIVGFGETLLSKHPKATAHLYQFKITLKDSNPPIWRRIQVNDCSLDKLHEYIQTAMDWTNSHLHHFRIGKRLYGDPELMQENYEDMGYKDSTTTTISDILPKSGKRFRFEYEYDFGDSWYHDVQFEKEIKPEEGKKYPLCLEGERACPPEDVGGIWGYQDFVEAIADPNHEQHEELLGWIGGKFDPEAFDAKKATKAMKKGLPDWRRMR
jgi:pRiA4b ORF-3-like protein